MVIFENESDDELAQRFMDFDPADGVRAPDEVVALHRAYANSDVEDDPAVLEAVRVAHRAGHTWEWIAVGLHTTAEEAQHRYGGLVA